MANSKATGVAYSDPAISGGTIDDTTIGATTAAAGTFTNLTSTGNTALGNASTDTIGFYGTTPTAQIAAAAQATSAASWVTICATKAGFGTSDEAVTFFNTFRNIQHVLKTTGLWKGSA